MGNGLFGRPTTASLCANSTIAPSYVTKVVTIINSLQANATTNAFLQRERANFVAYVKNTVNQVLASTNCTGFLTGLKSAMEADVRINQAQQVMARNIEQQFRGAATSALGYNGPNDLYGKPNGKPHSRH